MSDPSCEDGRGTLPAEGLGAPAFLLNPIEPIEGPACHGVPKRRSSASSGAESDMTVRFAHTRLTKQ